MMGSLVGIVCDKISHELRRVIVPTHDHELNNSTHVSADEEIFIVPLADVNSPAATEKWVRTQFGLPEPVEPPRPEPGRAEPTELESEPVERPGPEPEPEGIG